MATGVSCAQSLTLVSNDTIYICPSNNILPPQFEHVYSSSNSFDAWAVFITNDTTFSIFIDLSCTNGADTTNLQGYISLWEGDSATGTPVITQFQNARYYQNVPIHGSTATLHVHYDSCPRNLFPVLSRSLNVSMSSHQFYNGCSWGPSYSVSVKSITTTEADIRWFTPPDSSSTVRIKVNGQTYLVSGDSLHISGLSPNTPYYVSLYPLGITDPCCAKHTVFYTDPIALVGIPKATDFDSTYVRGYYGSFGNPFEHIGFVNQGSLSPYSRHCIHTDTAERDPMTSNLLHTVCPGKNSSIRLGNWLSGGQAEALTYFLHVDTNLYSLIMLHYAVLLQNPNHSRDLQPRFRMEIVDERDSVIDAQCGAADFYADSSLGWIDGLWKDWTSVGINLSPYHGQDVCLRFISYDCGQGGHWGYAYFTFDCQIPFITTELCGDIDTNTLTAPDGFNYLWYYDSPSQPVSTTQSVTYATSDGDIHCRLSFLENPSCYITMNTHVSNFWPLAQIDTLYTVNHGCDGYEVHFLNRSTIIDDNGDPLQGNPPCESALWNFGDSYISSQYTPTHTYRHPGTYTVTLIVKLSGGLCSDTVTYTITAPDAWASSDHYLTCCDSLLWIDSLWYSHDTVGPTARIAYPESCDTIYTLHLSTLPSSHYYFPTDTFCYNSAYHWRGHSAPINRTSADTLFPVLTDTLVAANGCDSLLHLPLVQLPPDRLSINNQPDCGAGTYLLTAISNNKSWQWSSSPHDPSLDGHETDYQIQVSPDSATLYTLTSFHDSNLFCPTSTSLALSRPSFPKALMEITPQVLSHDKTQLVAYDIGTQYTGRYWNIVTYGTGDTLHLPDSSRRITYDVPLNLDSITVILTVDDRNCLDTARQTVPVILTAVFVPNVFTPGADINNRFTAVCNGTLEAELTIYNRQGLLVYTTKDLNTGWDGTHNGQPCPQGAYVWHLRIRTVDRPNDWQVSMGTVTLLR